jgi:hypothetical protein
METLVQPRPRVLEDSRATTAFRPRGRRRSLGYEKPSVFTLSFVAAQKLAFTVPPRYRQHCFKPRLSQPVRARPAQIDNPQGLFVQS